MSVPDILKTIGENFHSSATVKNVYGDPVSVGDRTVIPVAKVSYGFGGGGAAGEGQQGTGGGGGGRMSAVPVGAIEVTPKGTRFIPFVDWNKLASGIVGTLVLALIIGVRRARVRRMRP